METYTGKKDFPNFFPTAILVTWNFNGNTTFILLHLCKVRKPTALLYTTLGQLLQGTYIVVTCSECLKKVNTTLKSGNHAMQ